jgi:2-methylcitrate dehydratase PrpD
MIRYLDFNDGYITPKGGGHPSDTIAALLSSAEIAGSSGRDLILATALSYEVFCKVADVLDTRGLGLDQATMLGLASVVGAGRLMGLTHEQMVHAIGITVGGNTAINQGRVGTLSNWKDFACADASRKSIFSAQLAQAGMTGPNQIFEGPFGFFKVISRKPPEVGLACVTDQQRSSIMRKSICKSALVAACAVSFSTLPTSSYAFSPEAQHMCTGDAFRLCSSEIPDIPRVTTCMTKAARV